MTLEFAIRLVGERESGGMADAPDLGSGAARRGGSSPPSRTQQYYATAWAQRLAEEEFADQVDIVVFADQCDAITVEQEIEMIAVRVLLAVACDGV
jgi:hypothetical protein